MQFSVTSNYLFKTSILFAIMLGFVVKADKSPTSRLNRIPSTLDLRTARAPRRTVSVPTFITAPQVPTAATSERLHQFLRSNNKPSRCVGSQGPASTGVQGTWKPKLSRCVDEEDDIHEPSSTGVHQTRKSATKDKDFGLWIPAQVSTISAAGSRQLVSTRIESPAGVVQQTRKPAAKQKPATKVPETCKPAAKDFGFWIPARVASH
mmetsp:Transcript_63115/g.148680  ORF Transcript_63115/g.148680 Transcript_63115/m.148680 type:complete len:207 (+) Transcript_63115:65-685(+)